MTLSYALQQQIRLRADAPAIVIASTPAITYGALGQHIEAITDLLHRANVGPQGRVAILIRHSGELAGAILAIVCNAVAIPMDPRLQAQQVLDLHHRVHLDALLTDDATLCLEGWSPPYLSPGMLGGTKLFLSTPGGPPGASWQPVPRGDEAMAFIVRTSGTTAQPKLVPATHANVLTRAAMFHQRLALTAEDRAFCVAKLFYGHGLNTCLFAPLLIGGSLACPPDPTQEPKSDDLLGWLRDLQPTYCSAGPTFYLNLLERALARGEQPRHTLRLMQTGGSAMPEKTRNALQGVFGVPVLDAYGTSETGQVTANGWEPAERREGSVGRCDASQLAVVAEDGRLRPAGSVGEIVARGPALSPAYLDGSGEMQPILAEGWYHSGDLGFIDSDGFLFLTGRVKELINRGGEKISPAEVDLALLRHPDVTEAAAFAVSHSRLGEDVAAAVVLRTGATTTALQLRQYLHTQLPAFKVPRTIHVASELPKGDSGKINRSVLSEHFRRAEAASITPPWSSLELHIVTLWARLLGRSAVGATEDFFELGGDSLLAEQMLLELQTLTGYKLDSSELLEAATPRSLAEALVSRDPRATDPLVRLNASGNRPPLVFFHGEINGGGFYTRRIAAKLGPEQPLWLLRPFDATAGTLPTFEAMAAHYLAVLKRAGLRPPFIFGGHCNGALLAQATAREAEAAGDQVALVILIDPVSLNARWRLRAQSRVLQVLLRLVIADPDKRRRRFEYRMTQLWLATEHPQWALGRLLRPLRSARNDGVTAPAAANADSRFAARMKTYYFAMAGFIPRRLVAKLVCITPDASRSRFNFAAAPWQRLTGSFESIATAGDHTSCLTTEADALIANIRRVLQANGK